MSVSNVSAKRKNLINALGIALHDASDASRLFRQGVAGRLGINSTDLDCLRYLLGRGPLAAGELAAASGLTSGAITAAIDHLEAAGLARRERDADDRRKVMVHAAPGAAESVAALTELLRRALAAALKVYADDGLEKLIDFLIRARAAATTAWTELSVEDDDPTH
jgi:DNA-binding MarR family transcriptional regulator